MQRTKTLLIVALAVLLVGCVPLRATVADIAADPSGFAADSQAITNAVAGDLPSLPYAVGVGIGYGLAFLRNLYKNAKRKKAKKSAG